MGTVTSPVESPRLGSIGLAILDAELAEDGTTLEVGNTKATVAPLAILDPQKQKPRA